MAEAKELDLSAYVIKPSQMTQPELIMLYGPPGGGKTHLAASISEVEGMYPVLIVDTEGSTAGTVADFDDERIDIFPVTTYDDFIKLTDNLLSRPHKYKTVIIDTTDIAQEWAVADHLEEYGKSNTFQAWGAIKSWTNTLGRDFKRAPFLAIMVFHESEDRTESGSVIGRKLALQGSAKDTMPGIPDVVGWVTRKADKEGNEVTTVEFAPSPKLATKNRFHLPARMVDADMSDIFEHIKNRKNKEEN